MIDRLTKAMTIGFASVMLSLGSGCARTNAAEQKYISYLGAAWGPDGDTIYFLKQIVPKQGTSNGRTQSSGIWFCKMNWDGSQKREIAKMWPSQDVSVDMQSGPVWMEVNASTSNVAFSVEYGMGTVGIWVMGLDGKNLRKPFEPVWNDNEKERVLHPSWNPDGNQIVYCKDSQRLEIFDFKTKKRTQLTNGILDQHPVWSPNGNLIAFTHYTNYSSSHGDRYIWLMKPDGSEQKPVVDEKNQPVRGWWPSWSPDGTKVGITRDLLFLADLPSHKVEYIDPFPILGESLPYTFMGHHWGKRGWLLSDQGRLAFIDSTTKKARLLALGGIYPPVSSSADGQWGIAPVDLEGKKP